MTTDEKQAVFAAIDQGQEEFLHILERLKRFHRRHETPAHYKSGWPAN
ncbi:hypothetical protein [Fructobacillus cardui]|nr:hypothetical protein [Fructobacillus cardui]MCK8627749.1 hypothetical protein [Fructobacillus cardui]